MNPRILLLAVALTLSCAPSEKTQTDEALASPPPSGAPHAPEEAQDPEEAQGPRPKAQGPEKPKAPSPLTRLRATSRLRYDLGVLNHFAVCGDHAGSLRIDLGEASALKHILGGWRSAWSPIPRRDGEVTYLEVNHESARVFFKQRKGGFDKVVVRMRAVARKNDVSVYLGSELLGKAALTEAWSEHTFEVPAEHTRDGEHQLVLKIRGSLRLDGRAQYAHVDAISVLAPGASASALPQRPAFGKATLAQEARLAMLAHHPSGNWTWRVQLPEGAPAFGLAFGSEQADARLQITARSDEAPAQVLLESGAEARWQEAVLDLKAFAGQVVELEVKASGALSEARPLAVAGGVYGAPPKDEAVEPKAPKVAARHALVYLIDTLRYDKIGVYNPKSTVSTPNFDAFARDATIFDAAYDTENWTKPSTASILTGLYPWNHRTKEGKSKLPESVTTIGEHLKRHRFKTAAFIANGYVSKKFGFGRGWHHYTNYIREGKVTDAGNLVDDTLGWIDARDKGERWFAYMHTIDPHVPYSAPGPWKFKQWQAMDRGRYGGPLKAQNTGDQIAEIKSGKLKPTGEDRVYFESLYDSEVAYNDHEFGRLIAGLKERGLYDDTAIIVLVDHGEEFWDHGSVGHGHSLYDEMVHSPLFLRHPGRVPVGRRVGQVVSTAATVPTLLALLDAPAMEDLDANALLDVLDGVGAPHPRVAVTDFMFRRKSIRAGRYHWLTRGGEGGELFDLATDKAEARNLSATHPIALAYARGHFGMFMGAADHARWWEDAARRPDRRVKEEIADVDAELQKQLEAMGYIEGATGEHSPEEDRKLMEEEDRNAPDAE